MLPCSTRTAALAAALLLSAPLPAFCQTAPPQPPASDTTAATAAPAQQKPGQPGSAGYVPGMTTSGPLDKDPVATSGQDRSTPTGNKIDSDAGKNSSGSSK